MMHYAALSVALNASPSAALLRFSYDPPITCQVQIQVRRFRTKLDTRRTLGGKSATPQAVETQPLSIRGLCSNFHHFLQNPIKPLAFFSKKCVSLSLLEKSLFTGTSGVRYPWRDTSKGVRGMSSAETTRVRDRKRALFSLMERRKRIV